MNLLFLLSLFMHMQLNPTERQVLLFYTNSGKEVWEKQKEELSSREPRMKERDVLIKSFNTGTVKIAVLRQWNVDLEKKFTFILVGRDGGEKFRSNKFVTADQLFALIDAMPMRKNEIQRSKERHD